MEISEREWLWVLITTVLILFLSSVPYLTGYLTQTPELVFSGAVFDRQDYAVHLSTMHLGAQGEWRYRLRFTSEEQTGAYVKQAYILLGHVARWLGAEIPLTYHIARLFLGATTCIVIYMMASWVIREQFWRRAAFFLMLSGGGLGWLQMLFGWLPQADISPVDFWLVDAYPYFGLMIFPHFAAVTTLVLSVVMLGISELSAPSVWKKGLVFSAVIVLQFIQPYAPLMADLALAGMYGGYWILKRRILKREFTFLLLLALSQIPLLVYNVIAFNRNPVWRGFVEQNVTLSPPPSYYIWGFGVLWACIILGSKAVFQAMSLRNEWGLRIGAIWLGLVVWALGALALAYAPLNLQRRFMMAFSAPLGLLATQSLKSLIERYARTGKGFWQERMLPAGIVAIAWLSPLTLTFGMTAHLTQKPESLFDPSALVEAVDWLDKKSKRDDIVLTSELTGQLVAARTGRPVYLGHPIETLNYVEKSRLVSDFFAGKSDRAWLKEAGVSWVISGPREGGLSQAVNTDDNLIMVYESEGVAIYQVAP